MQNEDVGFTARRRIFDTIGFTFINRLLVTGINLIIMLHVGCMTSYNFTLEYDGEEKPGYQQVAVAILVCFCTDTELVCYKSLPIVYCISTLI